MSIAIFDERLPVLANLRILTATGTAFSNLVPQNSGPYRIDDILLTNSDVIPHVVEFAKRVGGTDLVLGSLNVPAAQGYAGTPPIFAIDTLLPAHQAGWIFGVGEDLRARVVVAMGATFELHIVAQGGSL